MIPIEIQFFLRASGHSMASVARGLRSRRTGGHLTPAAVRSVIYGTSRSQRVERRIAQLANRPLHHLWPQWYGPDDKPIKKRQRYGNIRDAAARMDAINDAQRMVA